MSIEAISFHVIGRVQGVWFRASTVACAQKLGLTGWVRNRSDGSVEGCAEGAMENLDKLKVFLQHGPEQAQVRECHICEASVVGFTEFLIR